MSVNVSDVLDVFMCDMGPDVNTGSDPGPQTAAVFRWSSYFQSESSTYVKVPTFSPSTTFYLTLCCEDGSEFLSVLVIRVSHTETEEKLLSQHQEKEESSNHSLLLHSCRNSKHILHALRWFDTPQNGGAARLPDGNNGRVQTFSACPIQTETSFNHVGCQRRPDRMTRGQQALPVSCTQVGRKVIDSDDDG